MHDQGNSIKKPRINGPWATKFQFEDIAGGLDALGINANRKWTDNEPHLADLAFKSTN